MYQFREISQEDLQELKKIFIKTMQDDFPEYSKKTLESFCNDSYLNKIFNYEIKLGVFEDNKLVGYMIGEKHLGGVLFIHWLAIINTHQRKGLGSTFLKKAEEIGLELGSHSIHFEADERNIQYYNSHGYEVIGLDKKGYFGTDNYIMKKIIQEPNDENFFK